MQVGIVYTSTTRPLIALVNKELSERIGVEATYRSYRDPSILAEIREAGTVTSTAAARLVGLYTEAIADGADVILNCCSSVGEVADSMQDFARFVGIPIVRIDELMCREAVRSGTTIAVMATLSSTLEPTKHTLLRVSREMHRRITLVDGLIDGAFDLSPEAFEKAMVDKAAALAPKADVLLFAQGSMAYCEEPVRRKTGKTVLSSPRFGAMAVAGALQEKGLLKE